MESRLNEINELVTLSRPEKREKEKEKIECKIIKKIFNKFPALECYTNISPFDIQLGMVIRYVDLELTHLSTSFIVCKIIYNVSIYKKYNRIAKRICAFSEANHCFVSLQVNKHYYFIKDNGISANRYYLEQCFQKQIDEYNKNAKI